MIVRKRGWWRGVHLSSRTGWAQPHMDSGPVTIEAKEPLDPIVKRESSPDDVHAFGPTPPYESQEDVKPVVEGVSETPIVEVRINSKNQHLVFGNRPTSPPGCHVVKKESPEPALNISERAQYSSPSRVKREEEVHIRSQEICQALNNALSRVKTEG
ncbi:hypothetical protein BD413DRAFT_15858 [Trametes elegans]|nr:hypothetical protein BD413DRAFT_15858 [Trametes elegans]